MGERIAEGIEAAIGGEVRSVVLGHVQRGGTPTAYDRAVATAFGLRAAELVAEGSFGRMVALQGGRVGDIPLSDAVSVLKTVPERLYRRVMEVVAEP